MTALAQPLPDDPEALKAMLLAERAVHAVETERLKQIIKELQRHRFGRRAESLPMDQLEFALEEVQQGEAEDEAAAEAGDPERRKERAAKRRSNRGALPAHLPRIEQVVDVEDKSCRCCAGALHKIGEDIAERLDVIPAQFRVLVVRRPKYACRACQEVVIQAPAPARLTKAACPPKPWSPTWSSANTPITSRCTGKPRSTAARGSTWIARRSPTGPAGPPSCCARCTRVCWRS